MRKGTLEDAVNYWERIGAMLVCSLTRHPVIPCYYKNKDHPNILSNRGKSAFLLPLFLFLGLGLKTGKTITMYSLNSINEVGRKSY